MKISVRPIVMLGLAALAACAVGRSVSSGPDVSADASTEPEASNPTRDSGEETVDGRSSPERDAGTEASTCPSPCGIAPQCGCAAFEVCDLAVDAARTCTSSGTNLAGRACIGTFECARGLLCLSGVCRAPCDSTLAPCVSGACSDYPKAASDGGSTAAVAACSVACDYADDGSCGFRPGDVVGAGCVFRPELGRAECMSVRNVQLQNSLCNADAECGAGRACVAGSMGFSSCKRLCKRGAADACGGCGAFPSARVIAGVEFGYCP